MLYVICILGFSQLALAQDGDKLDDRYIDFSYAGYDFGESELPEKYDLPRFRVTDFGAIADDQLSDLENIREAIRAAENAGGGIVLFPKGRFLINEESGKGLGLRIESSHIILKGAGSGPEGTELFMKEHLVPDDPSKMWTTPPMIHYEGLEEAKSIKASLNMDASMGAFLLEFNQVPDLKAGDIIMIRAQGKFLNERMLEGRKTREIWENINKKGVEVKELHQVKEIEGTVVELRAPLAVDINVNEEWTIVKYNMIESCGFEDIHFTGNFLDEYVHHKDARGDSGYKPVQMTRCFNSWIRNCMFTNVSAGAHFKLALTSTMLNCSTDGNPGHECFNIATSTRCLMAYCEDYAPQWHGPCASHASVGTVIFRFGGISPGIDLHGSCPRHTLFDRCVMAGLDGERVGKTSHGGSYLDLPNHLIGLVLWNFEQTAFPRPGFNFWETLDDYPEQRYGPLTVVNPVIVGLHGIPMSFDAYSVGYMESMGKAVQPASLYFFQLEHRGHNLPLYLTNQAILPTVSENL